MGVATVWRQAVTLLTERRWAVQLPIACQDMHPSARALCADDYNCFRGHVVLVQEVAAAQADLLGGVYGERGLAAMLRQMYRQVRAVHAT